MKFKGIFIALGLSLFMLACGGTHQEGNDTNTSVSTDTATMGADTPDTVATTSGGTSGSNGTGTDTTDMNRQDATRSEGND